MASFVRSVKHLEEIRFLTLLGIRFWDAALDEQVRDGLTVAARREAAYGSWVSAFRTASGLYAFRHLPGLRDYETGARDPLASPPDRTDFVVRIDDRTGRYVPALFRVALPLPYPGIYPVDVGSPPGGEPAVPGFLLFSAPTRAAAPGLAVVRARLVDRASLQPAAHAVLEVEANGDRWRGIADARGQVAALFPYPMMDVQLHSSPPGLLSTPLQEQQWDVTVRVGCGPPLDVPEWQGLPDVASILHQPPALFWPTVGSGPVDESTWTLTYGQELILRTGDRSDLWIERGTSPL
jgi:hypothetical protein